ncbi:MAG: DNA polymerase III subunit delta [Propionibacteriaceae bacterium]|jgi:DNA polymerase-3 subunit delta|nr:DNA polymerase III subunit delta [Propionibacteriaceae bacterium]
MAFGSTLLIFGPESFLAERAVADAVRAARSERPDAEVAKVAAGELDAGGLVEVTGGSLLSSAAITVIDAVSDLAPELSDQLLALAADPGPDLALIIVHPGGVKGKGLLDKLKKIAQTREVTAIKPWELPQFAVAEARRRKGRMDSAAAGALVESVGSDSRSVAAAVRQLLDDSTDGQITEDEVRKYFSGRADATGYRVAEAAINGEIGEALARLRWAMSIGTQPPAITAAFANSLRHLGKYVDAADPHLRDADLARQIGVPAWKIKDLARQGRDWREPGVAKAIQAVAVTDAQVKGAAVDAGFALEQLVLSVARLRSRQG